MAMMPTKSKKPCFYRSPSDIQRNKKELDTAVSEIGKNISSGIQCDVSNLEDLDRAYDVVKDTKGRIDILYANAGIIQFAPLGKISE
jgi:NAD(P)-dependent dehydrogenase (short-subunit alcohol dehydrogenase family)